MEAENAIDLIRKHDIASTRYTNTIGRRGKVGAAKNLRRTSAELFSALMGRKPTPEEIEEMIKW